MTEVARLLRPGGCLIISAPHLVWLHNEPRDYWRFTPHGLRLLLEKAGLEPVSIQPVGGLICFIAYAPSTVLLALLWPIRPLFWAALWLHRLCVPILLGLDRLLGFRRLYPCNVLAVARRPQ